MIEDHVLPPPAPVLQHGLVVGDEDGDLPGHVGLVQSRPLQLPHELKLFDMIERAESRQGLVIGMIICQTVMT